MQHSKSILSAPHVIFTVSMTNWERLYFLLYFLQKKIKQTVKYVVIAQQIVLFLCINQIAYVFKVINK